MIIEDVTHLLRLVVSVNPVLQVPHLVGSALLREVQFVIGSPQPLVSGVALYPVLQAKHVVAFVLSSDWQLSIVFPQSLVLLLSEYPVEQFPQLLELAQVAQNVILHDGALYVNENKLVSVIVVYNKTNAVFAFIFYTLFQGNIINKQI